VDLVLRISLREEVTGTWSWKMRSGRAVVEGGVVGVGVPGLAMGGGGTGGFPANWQGIVC
jgi:hypothetical protein